MPWLLLHPPQPASLLGHSSNPSPAHLANEIIEKVCCAAPLQAAATDGHASADCRPAPLALRLGVDIPLRLEEFDCGGVPVQLLLPDAAAGAPCCTSEHAPRPCCARARRATLL